MTFWSSVNQRRRGACAPLTAGVGIVARSKLYAKMSKCFFFRESVDFLGHVVSAKGVQVDPKKVAVVQKWPPLKNVHGVQQFLGLGNYSKHYLQGYAQLIAPLWRLTKKKAAFVFGA